MLSLPALADIRSEADGVVSVDLEGESPARLRVECDSAARSQDLQFAIQNLFDGFYVQAAGVYTFLVLDN
jgi:hypothetical protein